MIHRIVGTRNVVRGSALGTVIVVQFGGAPPVQSLALSSVNNFRPLTQGGRRNGISWSFIQTPCKSGSLKQFGSPICFVLEPLCSGKTMLHPNGRML
jgi:hypothetical protein